MLWLTGGVSIGFLARTAGRTWAGVAVVEQSVTASRYVDCVVPCKSVEFGRSTSSVMTICWINRGCARPGFWLVQRVVREPVVAVVEQSVTASRYVDCVVPCKSVVFGRSTSSVMTICMINRGCVGLVSGSYSGSYVSQLLQW